jgi:Chitobiase/beta-hexosaminidase C-terminal domain
MRTLLIVLILALGASFVQAQDDSAQQAMQAMQQGMQANQQAIDQMQQEQAQIGAASQQQMNENVDQAQRNLENNLVAPPFAAKPKFSLKQGKYSTPETVKITDSTRGATVYYTTDGWTPTKSSQRYRGPVTVDSTTTLQAIAIAPYHQRSLVASAQYAFNAPASPSSSVAQSSPPSSATSAPAKSKSRKGIPVSLVFTSSVSSRTASVGDKIQLTLADDLKVGGVMYAPKGSPAMAIVTAVDKTGVGGAPGVLTFEAETLSANGNVIQLRGCATKEGEAKPPNAARLIPYAGFFTVLKHGEDAVIDQGAIFTAFIPANIPAAAVD